MTDLVCEEVLSVPTHVAGRRMEQVDILISKNQALQILYLKDYVYKTT